MSERRTIGLDLDNVISDTDAIVRTLINEMFGVGIAHEEVVHFDYWRCGITKAQSDEVFERFHGEACTRVVPLPGVVGALRQLSAQHRIVIVTSRAPISAQRTEGWLADHQIPHDELIFETRKDRLADRLNAFVDDHRETAYRFAELGVLSLLFDYPWNQPVDEPDPLGVRRVQSWSHALELLDA